MEDLLQRRMAVTGAALAAAAHVGMGVAFYWLSLPRLAVVDAFAAGIHLVALAWILRGRQMLGLWVVMTSAAVHLIYNLVVMGAGAGWGYYFLALFIFPLVFFRKQPRHLHASIVVLGAAALLGVAGTVVIRPGVQLDPELLGIMHGANLGFASLFSSVTPLVSLRVDRRHREELARLRAEVVEAKKLGQYTLGEKLGAGGMGQVYRATHAMLRRPAAIKLVDGDQVDDEALRRFEQEVQRTSELSHPNTIEIYDYGRTPDGIFYYVMEYLEGLDLQELVSEHGPQPPERVIHLLMQACEALEEAHGAGLVHRDIKPANLVLCRRGGRPDVVKVLDFGLVRSFDEDEDEAGAKFGIAGTPAYLAPEAVSAPSRVGPAADLYALGAVAYFLLCGRTVFEADNFFAMCTAHLSETPAPISERSPVPLPEGLEAWVMRCLAKDPDARPGSARELRAGLAALPVAYPWDEGRALAWWSAYDEMRSSDPSPAPAPAASRSQDVEVTLDAGSLADVRAGFASDHG